MSRRTAWASSARWHFNSAAVVAKDHLHSRQAALARLSQSQHFPIVGHQNLALDEWRTLLSVKHIQMLAHTVCAHPSQRGCITFVRTCISSHHAEAWDSVKSRWKIRLFHTLTQPIQLVPRHIGQFGITRGKLHAFWKGDVRACHRLSQHKQHASGAAEQVQASTCVASPRHAGDRSHRWLSPTPALKPPDPAAPSAPCRSRRAAPATASCPRRRGLRPAAPPRSRR